MEWDRALADTSGVGPEGQQWESLGRSPPAAESDLAELLGVLRAVGQLRRPVRQDHFSALLSDLSRISQRLTEL